MKCSKCQASLDEEHRTNKQKNPVCFQCKRARQKGWNDTHKKKKVIHKSPSVLLA